MTTLAIPRALSPSPFALQIQGVLGPMAVRRFRVTERISTPYVAEIDLDAALLGGEAIALGARTKLGSPRTAGPGRTFHGVITSVDRRGRDVDGAARYRLIVEPLFATLKHTRHRRIFHDMTSVAVAQQILREHGVPHRLRVLDEVPVHTHRIQYDESDLAFVERILFEEGIFYFFDHPAEEASDDPDATNLGQTEVLVLCDTAQYYPRAEPVARLVHRDFAPGEVVAGDETTAFDLARAEHVRPHAVLVRGRDPQRPIAELGDHDDRRLRAGEVPPEGHDLGRRVFARRPHLIYESDGTLEDRPPTVPTARRLQDEARADAVETRGSSLNPYLMPGRVVSLEGQDAEPEDLVIVTAEHFGEAPRDFAPGQSTTPYRNELVAAPASTNLRPARRSKPRVDGFDAAIVVGPDGQEIHTDEHGRVKVRFLWDVESAYDDKASAWLRVMQPWGGAGFGAQFLPRVGMEVMVAFVASDVDRPIVAGCVHNGASPPPFRYPEEKTKLGIRSRVSPGGVGFSEFVIDDNAGAESVTVRSERFLRMESKSDTTVVTGGARSSVVGLDSTETVRGDATRDVTGSTVCRVGGNELTEVAGGARHVVARRLDERIGGDVDSVVDGLFTESIGKSRHTVVGSRMERPKAVDVTQVNGNIRQEATDRIELLAGKEILMRVGRTTMLLTDEGVTIRSPHVELPCEKLTYGSRGGSGFTISDTIVLKATVIKLISAGASLVLDSEAKLDGANVKLNCGPASASAGSKGVAGEEGVATFRLLNYDPERHRNAVMRVQGPEGVAEHPVDGEGKVQLQGRPGDRFTLVVVLIDGEETPTEEVVT